MKADHDEDSEGQGDLGFTFLVEKNGSVVIHHRGRLAATLRGQAAAEFVGDLDGANPDLQQRLMARLTGNYKHGNERTAADHPRNRR